MRHGLLVGPRALASHVQRVLPAARVPEHELAMVEPVELTRRRSGAPGGGSNEDHGFIDEATEVFPETSFDVDELPTISSRGAFEALSGFDDASKEIGPVVLLETRKPQPDAEDYVRDLRRRIEDDDRR
ncbi:MAG: hypothetical protein H5U40_10595 [Polyangiaceae bacterium]|nr:hypothetical protein [Polyangiaceae bacterium]